MCFSLLYGEMGEKRQLIIIRLIGKVRPKKTAFLKWDILTVGSVLVTCVCCQSTLLLVVKPHYGDLLSTISITISVMYHVQGCILWLSTTITACTYDVKSVSIININEYWSVHADRQNKLISLFILQFLQKTMNYPKGLNPTTICDTNTRHEPY